jgi:hypothetical protein
MTVEQPAHVPGSTGLDDQLGELGEQIAALVGRPTVIGEPADDHDQPCITF